jgi:cell division protease FtsH
MIVGLLGGRAAEEIVFGSVTTGASNDIEKATSIARSMVTQYGMSEKFGLVGLETVESRYLDGRTVMNCADRTAAEVDSEVIGILAACYEEAKKLLSENRDIMDKIAAHLIEKETITGKEFMEIYCAEKGIPVPEPKNPLGKSKDEKKADKKEDSENTEKPETEAKADDDAKPEDIKADEKAEEKEEKPEAKETDEDLPFESEEETEEDVRPEDSILESYKNYDEKKEEPADDKEDFEEIKKDLEDRLSAEEKAEIEEMEKAKEEISNEVFKRIKNRAFKFEDDEEEK